MSASNLGIVFGPSLMRPRPTGATISLSSLVDYPHQARIVEAFIVFYSSIFQSKTSQSQKTRSPSTSTQQGTDEKVESSADGEEDGGREEQNKPESDKMEEGCGSSLGSLGSSEQLPDSDSELDESSQKTARSSRLVKQESEVSMDDDQLSYRDSLDLSSQSATHTSPEQEVDQEQEQEQEQQQEEEQEQEQDKPEGVEPPALPDSGPPDEETGAEQDLNASLAELNVNQSNNNYPCSPILSLSGHPLARLCGKKLPLTRNRDSEPEFV
ncbi:Rho GTPase-activating protein 45 [Larimichthys crocea]|uniref:Uncharacterized protein n=1 Tax=Larimichthys crocea TaxID=215358 RepID=A0ACD3RM12_LARCR|nr:Rho GTPase-activating protein 45 [Larimichthys crocea]